MSKEYLEALNKIQHDFGQLKGQELVSCYETIFNALKRLESIDNANPSEALECLNNIEADLIGLPKHITEYDEGFDNYLEDIEDNIDKVEQALLKAQEPKNYLKWEDLEFKIFDQEISVLLNGNKYSLKYYTYDIGDMAHLYKENRNIFVFDGRCSEDKQFFNDLHLERVKE